MSRVGGEPASGKQGGEGSTGQPGILQWLADLRDDFDWSDKQWRVATSLGLRLDWPHGRSGFVSVRQLMADAGASKQTVWRATKRLQGEQRLKLTARGGYRSKGSSPASSWSILQRGEGSTGEPLADAQSEGSTSGNLGQSEGSNDHDRRFQSSDHTPVPVLTNDDDADRSAAAAALVGSYGWPYEHCLKVAAEAIGKAKGRPLTNATSWVLAIVAKGPGKFEPGRFRPRQSKSQSAKPSRPPWCGVCHERTRMRESDDDERRPYPCPKCHPSTQGGNR